MDIRHIFKIRNICLNLLKPHSLACTSFQFERSHIEEERKTRRCVQKEWMYCQSVSLDSKGLRPVGPRGLSAFLRYERPSLSPPRGDRTADGRSGDNASDWQLRLPPLNCEPSCPMNPPTPFRHPSPTTEHSTGALVLPKYRLVTEVGIWRRDKHYFKSALWYIFWWIWHLRFLWVKPPCRGQRSRVCRILIGNVLGTLIIYFKSLSI